MPDRSDELAPLSALDELPIHQTVAPLRYVETTDPRAFERYWFSAHDRAGKFFLLMGFGFYPNMGNMDAYAIFVHEGRQTNVRAHRPLGTDRSLFDVGPFSASPVKPFEEWHLGIADNAQGLRADLRWRDTKRAAFSRQEVPAPPGINARLYHDWGGYETFGRVEGTITLGDKVFALNLDEVCGSRDHHWGVRNGVGGRGFWLPSKKKSTHVGQWVEFGDWSVWGDKILFNLGDAAQSGHMKVHNIRHRLRFDPVTKHFAGGIVTNRLETGEERDLHYELIGTQTAHLRCGLYTGADGRGTPEEDFHHGELVGERVDGESYDISDPAVRQHIGGMEDHLCRVTCNGETAIGVFEVKNPVLYDMCRDGHPGFEFLA